MRVMVTGANGFIGKNLLIRLQEEHAVEVVLFTREQAITELPSLLDGVDWVFHLAGINRSKNPNEFIQGNTELTEHVCKALKLIGRKIPIVLASSIQAEISNEYGNSKRSAEEALLALNKDTGNPIYIYRLPNVFGKWARPNYNSVVATFCHNIARDLPIQIHDPFSVVQLVYIDDVIDSFVDLLNFAQHLGPYVQIQQKYEISVGKLAEQIKRFKETRNNLMTEPVGSGLVRALYATFVSFLSPTDFVYNTKQYSDERGVFVEMLKTSDAGQFSFFTTLPGITRGGHYHHSKTEKFLVVKGEARFRFCHILTGEFYEVFTSGNVSEIVETVPGWSHDITNVGDHELICMLWANEIFDRDRPDTIPCSIAASAAT